MGRLNWIKRKQFIDKRANSEKTALVDLAANADLPTTVAKVNALMDQLRAGGFIG